MAGWLVANAMGLGVARGPPVEKGSQQGKKEDKWVSHARLVTQRKAAERKPWKRK